MTKNTAVAGWKPAASLYWGLRANTFAALVLVALVGVADNAVAGGFSPGSSLVLCAYTGTPPGTPCSSQDLAAGANADVTVVLNNPSVSIGPALWLDALQRSDEEWQKIVKRKGWALEDIDPDWDK